MAMERPRPQSSNVVKIPCKNLQSLLKLWLKFLKPYHKLSECELLVASLFLSSRIKLMDTIKDAELLDSVVLSIENKIKIREEAGIPASSFRVICTRLKQKGFIVDKKINPRFVPSIKNGDKTTSLLILMDIVDEKRDSQESC